MRVQVQSDTMEGYNHLNNVMEQQQLSLVPIRSLVPITSLRKYEAISRKYCHLLCKGVYYVPIGLQILKITLFLIWFDRRIFLNILFQFVNMLPPPQMNLEFPSFMPLMNQSSNQSIPMPCGPIPLGYGVFELPECPRCFLGYTCRAHEQLEHKVEMEQE